MTENDLQEIEKTMGFPLPSDYRRVMKDYPQGIDDYGGAYLLPDDAHELIERNLEWREDEEGRWKESYFIFGGDGGEFQYFLDLTQENSPVYAYCFEVVEERYEQVAPDFSTWFHSGMNQYLNARDWQRIVDTGELDELGEYLGGDGTAHYP